MLSTKPKFVSRWPKANNTLQLALGRAAVLTPAELADIMDIVKDAVEAMRTGQASRHQWELLSGQVEVSRVIEKQGVVKGLSTFVACADAALEQINFRCWVAGVWHRPTLYAQEITALVEFMFWHNWQVKHLSWAEYRAACNRAAGRITSAGGSVTRAHDLAEFKRAAL